MFLLVFVPHVGAHPDEFQLGVSIQSSINLGKTFPRISRIRIIPSTQILARVFVYLPPFISQILDLICRMVLILIFIYFGWGDTENQQYATSTSPIMHLICPPQFCINVFFNFSWHGCNIQDLNEKQPETYAKFWGANKVHYGRCASGDSSYLDQASLVNKVFILLPNYRGFDAQRFVLPLFSVLRVGRLPRH